MTDQVLPLRLAEHDLLQVLRPSFTLEWVHDGSPAAAIKRLTARMQ